MRSKPRGVAILKITSLRVCSLECQWHKDVLLIASFVGWASNRSTLKASNWCKPWQHNVFPKSFATGIRVLLLQQDLRRSSDLSCRAIQRSRCERLGFGKQMDWSHLLPQCSGEPVVRVALRPAPWPLRVRLHRLDVVCDCSESNGRLSSSGWA